jgi:hypothetical protein
VEVASKRQARALVLSVLGMNVVFALYPIIFFGVRNSPTFTADQVRGQAAAHVACFGWCDCGVRFRLSGSQAMPPGG